MSRTSLVAKVWLLLGVAATAQAQFAGSEVILGPDLERGAAPGDSPLKSPFGVGFDSVGTMYIVELEGGRVHRRDTAGRFSTIAGDGSKGYRGDGGPARGAVFNGMHNIAVTRSGDLYISDSWNHCIRKIAVGTGTISTCAGTGEAGFSGDGGPATKATFDFLMCISLNPAEDKIYVADLKNLRIRMVDLGTQMVSTIAGNGTKGVPEDGAVATKSPLVDPRAVAVDSQDNVYVLERGGHALRVVTPDGRIRTVAGTGTRGNAVGPALSSQLNSPKHLAIDAHDRVIIADDQNKRICRYDPDTKTLTAILGAGCDSPKRQLSRPHGVCVHADGSLFVVDTGHDRILQLTP